MHFVRKGSTALSILSFLVSPAGAFQNREPSSMAGPGGASYAINVRSLGGDGSANDRAINTAAKAACSGKATQKTLYLPGGVYELRHPIVLPCGLTLIGDGDATVLHPVSGSDGITFATTERVQIQNLAITYSAPAAPGTQAIRCDVPTGSGSAGFTVRDVTINNADTGIGISNCAFFILSANRIFSFASVGVSVANPTNADVGDGVIENNSIFNFKPIGRQIGIAWTSGGGLRIMNNKFGALYGGARFQLAEGAVTSQLFIQGNSFDTMDGYGVQFTRAGATGTLSDVLWNGNVCTSCVYGLSIPRDPHGPWITNIVATGNTFVGKKQRGVGAFMIDSAHNVILSSNTLFSNDERSMTFSLGGAVSGATVGPMITAGKWAESKNSGFAVTVVR